MKRITVAPRPDWQSEMARIGFNYHSIDGNYWQEDACYVFTESQIDLLEDATNTLHHMYVQAVAHVVKTGDYARLGIDDIAAKQIEDSFGRQAPSLYGRFDLCFDGINPPKLYEYNADTPTALFEASVAQWYWLQAQGGILRGADQFNNIHERLLVEFESLKPMLGYDTLYLTAVSDSIEDLTTTQYLQDVAIQAGLQTDYIDIGNIGYRMSDGQFTDLNDNIIRHLFKLYPWEWLLAEEFGQHIASSNIHLIEPAYKLLMSNKALLTVLWEMFPNHPNLLAASLNPNDISTNVVKKPFFSREGANISLTHANQTLSTHGQYGQEGYIYQEPKPLPKFSNNQGQDVFAVIGSWIVGHSAAGIGIREDSTLITKDTSLFVPHAFI
ncbi:glutathionylspermidine synthase family protein [Moraxella catarrhalis]|uniref:glutathionylspermidine synthase family protein n=1 Tax=Moraxella catarrhalis TaxID=480 RepID=UPI000EA93E1B|nr:glutathionylspermidine synthase family protein [Moraxella catarrhalis]AZQ88376.1 glutathionylspermidine synthase preATP-grasp family protein [Moraxella catarrhalis]MPW77355.1 glutathionylspermidine synthase [Moraxella catarrhalis]MPW94555.1 glutathionylspermidine synthase family protein [Moraxella catarrhalis]MPW95978.1 glutathionylspermidine synthase family protein [Moraxella catarrhalis]MPW99558.1 glutathionylspermidine synthase [Moraxella catarrhalis]